MNFEPHRVAFIGAGQMATALAHGFSKHLLPPSAICACDPYPGARSKFEQAIGQGVRTVTSVQDGIHDATIIFLAVKPQVVSTALKDVARTIKTSQILVSIAAGITLRQLQDSLPDGSRVIRVMPNTPCLIGKGASGLSGGAKATTDDMNLVTSLLQTVGLVEQVSEYLLDAVTGLSGSGPAYGFQIIEALSDGGVRMGLPRAAATRLAAQTLAGAAEMVLQTGKHPGELKDAVASPGGTTIAGLHALERGGLRAALMNAVEAASLRSAELGKPS